METEQLFAQAFLAAHPEDAAPLLERLSSQEAAALLEDTPPQVAAALLRRMAPFSGAECLTNITPEPLGPILSALPLDVAAGLLRRLDRSVQERLLAQAAPEVAGPLHLLLQYPAGSAGALMDPRALALPEDITVSEASERIRQTPQHVLYYLYVVNREHGLVGVLNLRELMLASPTARLTEVMRGYVARISARADRTTIVAHSAWRDVHALPVVDDVGVFLGTLRYETLRHLENESTTNRQTQNAVATFLTVGELYLTGLSRMLAGLVSALTPPAARQKIERRTDHDV
ncbi:MAG: CBS domain-containing protein [Candidatus Binatia bacterium]